MIITILAKPDSYGFHVMDSNNETLLVRLFCFVIYQTRETGFLPGYPTRTEGEGGRLETTRRGAFLYKRIS